MKFNVAEEARKLRAGSFVEVTGSFVLENGEVHVALSTLREVLPDLGWYWDEVEKRATRKLAALERGGRGTDG